MNDIEEEFIYEGFGFMIILENVKMVDFWGQRVPDCNIRDCRRVVADRLSLAPWRLTGNHVCFLWQYLDYSVRDMNRAFNTGRDGLVACMTAGSKASGMSWSSEKGLRTSAHFESGVDGDGVRDHTDIKAMLAGDEPTGEWEVMKIHGVDIVGLEL